MKRIVCLLLCFTLLFCIGCKEEPEPEPEKYKGVLHTIDGLEQNSAVHMAVTDLDTENHTFYITIYNDTDYELGYNDLIEETFSVFLWQNNAWLKITEITAEYYHKWTRFPRKLAPHSSVETHCKFYCSSDFDFPAAGVYRMVLFEVGLSGVEDNDPFANFDICAYYSTDNTVPTAPQDYVS